MPEELQPAELAAPERDRQRERDVESKPVPAGGHGVAVPERRPRALQLGGDGGRRRPDRASLEPTAALCEHSHDYGLGGGGTGSRFRDRLQGVVGGPTLGHPSKSARQRFERRGAFGCSLRSAPVDAHCPPVGSMAACKQAGLLNLRGWRSPQGRRPRRMCPSTTRASSVANIGASGRGVKPGCGARASGARRTSVSG